MSSALVPRRINPRRRTILRLESGKAERERVLNLSVNGMFVEGGRLAEADKGVLWIPGEDRPLELRFRSVIRRPGGIGVQFDTGDRRTRNDLHAYVNYQHEQDRLRAIETRLHNGLPGNLKPLSEDAGMRLALRPIELSRRPIEIYRRLNSAPIGAVIAAVDDQNARISMLLDDPSRTPDSPPPSEFDDIFLVLRQGEATYLADTVVEFRTGVLASAMLPERFFLPERRTLDREEARGTVLRVDAQGRALVGEVLQLDANGIAALFFAADARMILDQRFLPAGQLCSVGGERTIEALRVAWSRKTDDGRVRIGLERILPRIPIAAEQRSFPEKSTGVLGQAVAAMGAAVGSILGRIGWLGSITPAVWVMSGPDQRPLVNLMNATFDLGHPPPRVSVVLIPPPYGRRKEMPAALALTLVQTFRAVGQHVLVLRWDGTNHVGESWRDSASAAPEHAMLHYTQSQAVADLRLVLASVRERLPDAELQIAVVSFSLAAVAVRKLLALGAPEIQYWVAPMGAADARDTIRNGNGGVDLVGQKKAGNTLGICLIQGHLVDADRHCSDLVEGGFADLEDARADMARISQPVTWICGTWDYWVNAHRVRDVLGVPAPGPRELIEVPTGHFLRTSVEALAAFRIIAERVVSRLTGQVAEGQTPSASALLRTTRAERDRLARAPFDAAAYWREYLMGNPNNPLGFDILALTDEYEDLIQTQLELLSVQPGWHVADLGCGTGNSLAAMIHQLGGNVDDVIIEAVDLIPEAIDRARRNVAAACREIGLAVPPIRFQLADLSLRERPNLPWGTGSLDAVLLSLVIPYIEDPGPLMTEILRVLKPGGRLVVSTLRPDVDMSGPVARLREKLERGDTQVIEGWTATRLGSALRDYVNRAATLLDHEVAGRFTFRARDEFSDLLRERGFRVKQVATAFGTPPMALVAQVEKPDG